MRLAGRTATPAVRVQLGHTTTATTDRHYRKRLRSDRRNISIIDGAHAARERADHGSTVYRDASHGD